MYLAILKIEIVEATYKNQHILPIVMEGDVRFDQDNEWWTYCETTSQLDNQRGQAFYMIRGQWMQLLLDKTRHDPDWDNTSESYDPIIVLNIIGKFFWLMPNINIAMQQCTIKSVQYMSSINTTWRMNSMTSD